MEISSLFLPYTARLTSFRIKHAVFWLLIKTCLTVLVQNYVVSYMGMCRWMGLHFHVWINYIEVTF